MNTWCIRAEVEFSQTSDYLLPGEGAFRKGNLSKDEAEKLLPLWKKKAKEGFTDGHGETHPLKVWIEKESK